MDKAFKYDGNPDYVRVAKSLSAEAIDEYNTVLARLRHGQDDKEEEIKLVHEMFGESLNKLKTGLAKLFTIRSFN